MEKILFGKSEGYYRDRGAILTAGEIAQQPAVWRKAADNMLSRKAEIKEFMDEVMSIKDLRIVFTGAGSSAFIGEAMMFMLANELGIRTEAVHSTDIISAPDSTLFDVPTLLISYGRSGESPESKAVIDFAAKRIKNLYNIVIVCDKNSTLASMGRRMENSMVLDMPEESSDKGFAMTSSVSCMALATWCLFHYKDIEKYAGYIKLIADSMSQQMDEIAAKAEEIARVDYRRIFWLGTGALKGLAREAAIKSMELSDGYVNSGYDAPTGFRHGPKTVINNETITVHFLSNQEYSLRYDVDLAEEVIHEKDKNVVVTVKPESKKDATSGEDYEVIYKIPAMLPANSEIGAYIGSLLFAQLLSMMKSLEKGYMTDSPCKKGTVNRVVKGIVIYDI
jgi:tagatose-6-phosphate ketose/aldose isomerase